MTTQDDDISLEEDRKNSTIEYVTLQELGGGSPSDQVPLMIRRNNSSFTVDDEKAKAKIEYEFQKKGKFYHYYHFFHEKWRKLHSKIESWMESLFYNLGKICAEHPIKIILACLVIVAIFGSGILLIEWNADIEVAWVPVGSQSTVNKKYYLDYYGDFQVASAIVTANPEGENVIEKGILNEIMNIHTSISKVNVSWTDGKYYSLNELCMRPLPIYACGVISILQYWHFDPERLKNDPDPLATINNPNAKGPFLNILNPENFMGGIERDANGKIVKAKALFLAYVLNDYEGINDIVHVWTKSFIDITDQKNVNNNIATYHQSLRSQKDEVDRATKDDAVLFAFAVLGMFLYVSFSLGKCGIFTSKALLGLSGIIGIVFALVMGFGICGFIGAIYTPAVLAIPFLILGIGVDDMFIITNAFASTDPSLPRTERIARSLSVSAVSITITSLTNFFAFIVGSLTKLPAMSGFCLYASYSVLFDYLLQITFFTACMALDARREESSRLDCIPCFKIPNRFVKSHTDKISKPSLISRFFEKYYGPFILHKYSKIAVIILSLVFLSFGFFGSTRLQSGFSDNDVLPEDSFVLKYQQKEELYFEGFNFPLFVIFQTFDYSDPELQDEMLHIVENIRDSGLISMEVTFWFEHYLDWLQTSYHNTSLTAKGRPPNERTFYLWLYEYLTLPNEGMRFMNDIVFQYGAIKTSRLSTNHIFLENDFVRAQAVVKMRELTQSDKIPAFAYCWRYVFWEQYVRLVQNNLFSLFFGLSLYFWNYCGVYGKLEIGCLNSIWNCCCRY